MFRKLIDAIRRLFGGPSQSEKKPAKSKGAPEDIYPLF